MMVFFTRTAVIFGTGPELRTPPSIAKPIAALVIRRTRTLRHLLGPGSLRTIVHDGLREGREREPCVFLKPFGVRKLALYWSRRHDHRRRRWRNRFRRRRCSRNHRLSGSSRRFYRKLDNVARGVGGGAPNAHRRS